MIEGNSTREAKYRLKISQEKEGFYAKKHAGISLAHMAGQSLFS